MADVKDKPNVVLKEAKKIKLPDGSDGWCFEEAYGLPKLKSTDDAKRWLEIYGQNWGRFGRTRANQTVELERVLAALKEATEIEPAELVSALRIAGYQIEAEYSEAQMEVIVRFRKVKQ
jgi:hypothetical protein